MADVSSVTSYQTVGRKEDVADTIYDISPTATPFQSMIGRKSISSRLFEWQEDELDAVEDNAEVEGFEPGNFDFTPTVMRDNVTQIFSRTVKVPGTTDSVAHYGRGKESAYQLMKKSKEAKRNLEHTLVGLVQSKNAGNSSTPRRMHSALNMIDASVTISADSGSGNPDVLQYADVKECIKALYDAGAIDTTERMTLMVPPAAADDVAGWAKSDTSGVATREISGQATSLVDVVDLLRTPWGIVRVVQNRWLKSSDALILDPSNFDLCWLRPWKKEELAKTGDARRWLLVGECGLKHKNYKSTGRIDNLSY